MRRLPQGLMVMGIVLVTAAAVSGFDGPKAAPSCTVCSTQAECPGMDGGTRIEILDIQNGSAVLMTVSDPEKVAGFHQAWDKCQGEMEKAMKMSRAEADSLLCEMCRGYYTLMRQGARFECVKTEAGALGLMTAKKAKLVQAIQQMSARQRQMMAKKEPCCALP